MKKETKDLTETYGRYLEVIWRKKEMEKCCDYIKISKGKINSAMHCVSGKRTHNCT